MPLTRVRQRWRDQGMRLPQAMGSGPLAQPLFYQYSISTYALQALQNSCRVMDPSKAKPSAGRPEPSQGERSDSVPNNLPAAQPREAILNIPLPPLPADRRGATAAAGEQPCLPTPSPAPKRRAAAAGRCSPRRSRGTLKDGRRRLERVDSEARSIGLTVAMAKAPWTRCQKLV